MSSALDSADSPPPAYHCYHCLERALTERGDYDGPTPRLAPPGFKDLTTREQREWLVEQIRREKADAALWDLRDNDPCFTFAQAIGTEWCRFKTEKKFASFLRRLEYPERLLINKGWITQAAYQAAEKKAEAARRDAERLRKRSKRKSRGKKAESAADTH